MKSILLLNGPNLNLLGTREKEIYGSLTLEEIESNLLEIAKNNSINLSCFQSNAELELVNAIKEQDTTIVALEARIKALEDK